jgi:hypothetical protein
LLDALLAGVPWDPELALIGETVEVASDPAAFPHLLGEVPSPATMWRGHGFDDTDVERWLELGVWSADAAAELREAGIDRQYIAAEHSSGVTRGWAFCAGDVSLEEVGRG